MNDQRVPEPVVRRNEAAHVRARVFALLRFSLLFWACAYFTLVAISGHTYIRSFAFGLALTFALWLIAGALFSDNEPIPVPNGYLLAAIGAWSAWSALSYFWSVHPNYTKAEIGTEVGWGLATATIFYTAARSDRAFRAMVATAVGTVALLALLAIHAAATTAGFDPERALPRSHGGVGAYSTCIVLVAPLLPLMLAPRPAGFGVNRWSIAAMIALFVLLLVAARLTENRMIWVALAAGFVVAATLAALRWRAQLKAAPLRWSDVLAVLLIALAALFVDAAIHRTHTDFKRDATVAQAIAEDPRLVLWQHTFERIRERPWLGYGFGKSILREELQGELGDPLLAHAHNLFVSQWLQTGAIGALAMLALLASLAWRYASFLRASEGPLAAIGLAGLVLLVAFVVKNMTDDFMIRPTSKEFWALNALLVGYGIRRERSARAATADSSLRSE